MDQFHISMILNWPVPQLVHDIQVFLGLANYYYYFIEGYLYIVLLITDLLWKNSRKEFTWAPKVQATFKRLKKDYTSVSVLKYFDPVLAIQLHIDSSNFALSRILSQLHGDHWHPTVLYARKCLLVECNYDIHDCKILAIDELIKHWRHYLEGSR